MRKAILIPVLWLGSITIGSAQDLIGPSGLVLAPEGTLLVADRGAHFVVAIHPEGGQARIIAGTGDPGFSGDGGPATEARLQNPEWLDMDSEGNLYIADRGNHRVRRVDAISGRITTIAGNGVEESSGDGGPATAAGITNPFGIELDHAGFLYIFDTEGHRIRRVNLDSGIIHTVVGTGERGFSGDGGPGLDAMLARPHNGFLDRDGRLIFGDSFNIRIRSWDPKADRMKWVAGTGELGSSPSGTQASEFDLHFFGAILRNRAGDLVFTSLDDRILRMDAETGTIWVLAGTGIPGFSGDGGPAVLAQIDTPYGLVEDEQGNLYFAELNGGRIRRVDGASGRISTVYPQSQRK